MLTLPQPIISRNLGLLREAGLLQERRQGKLIFYHLRHDLSRQTAAIVSALRKVTMHDPVVVEDLRALADCNAFKM